MGGDGLVPGIANVAPALMAELQEAATRGDAVAATRLQTAVGDLCGIYDVVHFLPALKAACQMLGIGSGVPSLPLLPAIEAERRAIAAILARHGLGRAAAERGGARATARIGA
jgi:4-hydroxy-tetrahydrodipicolinate synthase